MTSEEYQQGEWVLIDEQQLKVGCLDNPGAGRMADGVSVNESLLRIRAKSEQAAAKLTQ